MPWGTHLCLFCETKQDLVDSALTFLGPGAAGNEYCLWVASEPLTKHEALSELSRIPELEAWRIRGGVEVRANMPGYSGRGQVDIEKIAREFHRHTAAAEAKGFAGVRICTNPPWRRFRLWSDINAYERLVDRELRGRTTIMLCTYLLEKSESDDVLNVARTHQCVMARRRGGWQFLETAYAEQARKEIAILNRDPDRLPARLAKTLTERERIVLGQIVKGASSRAVARTLGISPRTVEFHRANAMQKLGARNTAELVRMALQGR